jgi:hypothetical protein
MRQERIKVTDWARIATPPGRIGTYQLLIQGDPYFAHWDGYAWSANLDDHGLIAYRIGDLGLATHWRGLSRDARASRLRVKAGRLYGLG